MKEVPRKDLPEISGGEYTPVGSNPQLPAPSTGAGFPRDPVNPAYESPPADQ